MTSPTSTAAARSRRATWAAYGLFAAAVAVLLLQFVLAEEHVREDRDGSFHYWTTYPFGEAAADAALQVLTALAIATVGALVLAAFVGPAPSWWRSPDRSHSLGSTLLLGYAAIVTVVYAFLSIPFLGYDDGVGMTTRTSVELAIGVVAAVAAVRAWSWAVSVPLGLIGAVLVNNSTGEAAVILLHGALTIGLGCLVFLAVQTTRGWVRSLAIAALAGGVVLWLFLLLFISFYVTCECTGGCVS